MHIPLTPLICRHTLIKFFNRDFTNVDDLIGTARNDTFHRNSSANPLIGSDNYSITAAVFDAGSMVRVVFQDDGLENTVNVSV